MCPLISHGGSYWDAIRGQQGRGCCTIIKRHQAVREGWKIIKTRRIGISIGNDSRPVYRNRLVGMDFNNEQMNRICDGTPPLEASGSLITEAATVRGKDEIGPKVLMINDDQS